MATGHIIVNKDDKVTVDALINKTIIVECTVDEATGIGIGKCCYLKSAVGSVPEVALASIDDPTHRPLFGVSSETKSDGQSIRLITQGYVTGINTVAMAGTPASGSPLYLGSNGDLVVDPSGGNEGNVQIGGLLTTGTGAIGYIDIVRFALSANFDGVLRSIIENTSAGTSAGTSFTAKNDVDNIFSLGLTGSLNTVFGNDSAVLLSTGTGATRFVNTKSNVDYIWRTNVGAGTFDNMTLKADGQLELTAKGVIGGKETTTPSAKTDFWKTYSKSDNCFYFQSGDGVEHKIADQPFASHDVQGVSSNTPQVVSSASFINVTNASIVAKNLGENGTYVVEYSASIKFTDDEETLTFRLQPGNMEKAVTVKEADGNAYMIFNRVITGVEENDEFKVEVKISASTASILDYDFTAQGTPESAVQ